MRDYQEFHPFTNFIFYVLIIGFLCFQNNPFFTIAGLAGFFISEWQLCKKLDQKHSYGKKEVSGYLALFVLIGMLNPLFWHQGTTVLFYLNDKQITLEALLYGYHMSFVIVTVLLWCRQLSRVFHEQQVLFLIKRVSKTAALILSMTLKWIPSFQRQARKIKQTQIAMGCFDTDSLWDLLKSHLRVYSATVTWALEHSIVTADSMRARGYGTGKRSFVETYRFMAKDVLVCILEAAGFLILLYGKWKKLGLIYFYPKLSFVKLTGMFWLQVFLFAVMCILPSLIRLVLSKNKKAIVR